MVSTVLFLSAVGLAVAAVAGRRRWRAMTVAGLVTAAAATVVVWVLLCGTFDLRKVLGTMAMPAGLVWLGLLGLAWWRTGRGRPTAVLWVLWVAFTVAGNGLVGGAVLSWLERPYAGIDPFAGPTLDAVVVLGGGVRAGEDGRPALGESGDRPVLGARLLWAGRTRLLVTTGPVVEVDGAERTVPGVTARLWTGIGVPHALILEVPGPRTTAEEMDALARLVEGRGWRRVGLVTSGYHMRRAMALARARGLDLEPLPAGLVGSPETLAPQSLLPSGEGFAAVHRGCWELLGRIASR